MKSEDNVCCNHIHDNSIEYVEKKMADNETTANLADFYKVFGDATRVRILCALMISELCVCDLADILSMNQSAISHQLRVLKQAKLVKNRRDGKTIFYSLADGHIQTIISQGMEHIAE
ncbi:MAG: ArsR/SmtB family transcription factor [Suipraeoptans sp.]